MAESCICRHKIGSFITLVILVVILAVAVVLVRTQFEKQNDTLQLVAVLHRHGFREISTSELYKNDPYGDESKFWPLGYGQLTLVGKRQLYQLGKNLKALYDSYLPRFTTQSVYVRTSDYDRCHMSVASLLAALFPPQDDQIFNPNLLWQPIPIHSMPREMDSVLAQAFPCPRFEQEYRNTVAEYLGNATDDDKKFFKYLGDNIGQEVNDTAVLYHLYSGLRIKEKNNYVLPDWSKKIYPDPLTDYAILSMKQLTWTTEMKRLFAGPFVEDLLDKFQKKSTGNLVDNKLFIYSAHDTTIATVWNTLGLPGPINPDFGAALIFELHSIDSAYFVRFSYLNNTEQTQPLELQLHDCTPPCPFEYFVNATASVISSNWTEECRL